MSRVPVSPVEEASVEDHATTNASGYHHADVVLETPSSSEAALC
jgi:hypothetical protein